MEVGPIESAVREDIKELGDLAGVEPSLSEMAYALARQIDSSAVRACECGEEIPGHGDAAKLVPQLTRELRQTLAQLFDARPEGDDDDLGDLAEPEPG